MRSNSERDRNVTNHHTSTMSLRKMMYRDPHDYQSSNGTEGEIHQLASGHFENRK